MRVQQGETVDARTGPQAAQHPQAAGRAGKEMDDQLPEGEEMHES